MKPKVTTVSIPKSLATHVKERITGTGFKSVSAYVTHVLTELEAEIDNQDAGERKRG